MKIQRYSTYNIEMAEEEIDVIRDALHFYWRTLAGNNNNPLGGYGMESLHEIMESFNDGSHETEHYKEVIEAKYFDNFFKQSDNRG